MSRHVPERPFGRCDTEQTVAALKAGLVASGLDILHVDGLNINGRDCVYLALLYGVRANDQGQRIVHDRDNGGVAVNLEGKTAADIRNMCADHIITVWNAENTWDRAVRRMRVQYEARAYFNMPDAPVEAVRDAYCNAIRGVGVAPMYGDQGVQIAFAARFTVTVLSWFPPRPQANRTRNQMFRPYIHGSAQVARAVGERSKRTPCLMIMCVLADGMAHAEPVRARRPDQGRPSRFTGVIVSYGVSFLFHFVLFLFFFTVPAFFATAVPFFFPPPGTDQ
jgi:hypothetical protein